MMCYCLNVQFQDERVKYVGNYLPVATAQNFQDMRIFGLLICSRGLEDTTQTQFSDWTMANGRSVTLLACGVASLYNMRDVSKRCCGLETSGTNYPVTRRHILYGWQKPKNFYSHNGLKGLGSPFCNEPILITRLSEITLTRYTIIY